MGFKSIIALIAFAFIVFIVLMVALSQGANIAVLNPQGTIARQQMELGIIAVLLMLIVVAPVTIMIFVMAVKYRAGNKKVKYDPNMRHSKVVEALWWIIPSIIILFLGIITWKNTHALDPYRPIQAQEDPLRIQVVALQWKWLFLYPEQGIATVNFVQFPEDTPLTFELTADNAPMSSFWIPSLGGQIYTMTGMETKIHLMADSVGDYSGKNAEINGRGFSKMNFVARASTREDFDQWVREVQLSSPALDQAEYDQLIQPSEKDPVRFYSSSERGLYNKILLKYMAPPDSPVGEVEHND